MALTAFFFFFTTNCTLGHNFQKRSFVTISPLFYSICTKCKGSTMYELKYRINLPSHCALAVSLKRPCVLVNSQLPAGLLLHRIGLYHAATIAVWATLGFYNCCLPACVSQFPHTETDVFVGELIYTYYG